MFRRLTLYSLPLLYPPPPAVLVTIIIPLSLLPFSQHSHIQAAFPPNALRICEDAPPFLIPHVPKVSGVHSAEPKAAEALPGYPKHIRPRTHRPRSSAWGRPARPGLSTDSRNPTGFPGGAARQPRRRDHPRSPGSHDLTSPIPRRVLQVPVKPHAQRNRHRHVHSRKLGGLFSSMARGAPAPAQAQGVGCRLGAG